MTSQHWWPSATCAEHVWRACLCAGVVWLFAAPALSNTINGIGYESWQWHGITCSTSSSSPASSAASSNVEQAVAAASVPYLTSTPFAGNGGTGSLSGFVYVDENDNHVMDSADWAIASAKLSITESGSSTPAGYAISSQDGSYSFDGLATGTYSISLLTPSSKPGQDSGEWRTVTNDAAVVSVGTAGTIAQSAYNDITLGSGDAGTNFNFAELAYPGDLISKAMFLMSSPAILHTSNVVTPTAIPEPGSLVLLAITGLALGGLYWRRCRRGHA